MAAKPRPIDAGVWHSRLPSGARVSIAHRLTGILLVALLPLGLYLIDFSLRSAEHFARVTQWWRGDAPKLVALVCLWAFAHHFFAGLRHLLLDLDVGIDPKSAHVSAAAVWVVSAIFVLAIAIAWWR